MHLNRFRLGDPAGGAYSASQTPSWNKEDLLLRERGVRKKRGEGGEENGEEGRLEMGRGEEEREGKGETRHINPSLLRVREREGADGERVGKGEGGLDLNSCPGVPEFLVTPLGEAGMF